jgi:hypothetical protein
LKNRVQFELRNAINNPEANQAAEEAKRKEEEVKKKEEEAKAQEQKTTDEDKDKFSIRRLFGKIGNYSLNILRILFVPFVALILSMFVANECIMYRPPVRILFFLFTFLICYFLRLYMVLLVFYYIVKAGYSFYINNMTDGPKRHIMPSIFAMLPITTYEPTSSLGYFFLYPFRYPKSIKGEELLSELRTDYWNQLEESFPGLKSVMNMPIIAKGIQQAKDFLDHLHDRKESPLDLNITKENKSTAQNQTQQNEVIQPNTN